MANITVSTSNNFDASANLALNNGETITINSGSVLTMSSDNRWSQNAAVPLSITIDAASGGELLMDGRDVWWLPYTSGSGTVPVLGTTFPASNVTSATASGEFLGIFPGLGVAPSSGTMPATGFIKLRSKTGSFANAQSLNLPGGATATASGAGQRGWLNIVGAETGTITIPRLGKWTARGDWFDLATTSGSRDQAIQYFVADYCPALWIETSAGSGVYEIWLNAGSRWSATFVSMDARGKFFGCTAAGVITLAATGYGKLPASGCKIRVPNIHISSTTSASSYLTNTINTTQTTRWETSTNSAGAIDLAVVCAAGLYLQANNAYSLQIMSASTFDGLVISAMASKPSLTAVAVGLSGTLAATPFDIRSMIGVGATLTDCAAARYSGSYCVYASQTPGLLIDGGTFTNFAADGVYNIYIYDGCHNSTVKNATLIGGELAINVSNNVTAKDNKFSARSVGAASTSLGAASLVSVQSSQGSSVSNVSIMADGVSAANYCVAASACSDLKIRTIGTYGAPFDCGSNTGRAINLANCSNTKIQRVYVKNTRIDLINNSGSRNTTHESVMGDATGDAMPNIFGSIVKGHFGGDISPGSAVFGGHFYDSFRSTTTGFIGIFFNEPTLETASNVQNTTAQFSATGAAYLRDLGDQITYTWPHFILGYTSLANVAPALSGTNTGNLTIEYDLDKGSGFSGTWQTCNATNLSAETGISATTGFKPMFRFTCATASTSNAINGFYITGTTDATSQQTQYPLDVSTLTLTGLPAAAEVRCYTGAKDGSAVEIGGVEATGGTTFTFTHSSGGSSGFIHIIHPSYKIKEIDYTYAVADTELLIQMDPDPWYQNPV